MASLQDEPRAREGVLDVIMEDNSVVSDLTSMPQEIIDLILKQLPEPNDLVSVASINTILHEKVLASSAWAVLLKKYWRFDNSHISDIFERPPSSGRQMPTDGYAAFCSRMVEEVRVGKVIESLVDSPCGRLKAVEFISKQFMDNADAVRRYRLSRGRSQGDFAVDYHCLNIERHLSRKLGIHILDKIGKYGDDELAKGYSALFALFAVSCFRETDGLDLNLWEHIHGMYAEYLYGSSLEDGGHEAKLRRQSAEEQWQAKSIEERIADVGKCMSQNGYIPASEATYNDLASTFLGNAMLEKHVTIPINLVAVFCALCQEFGMQAKPVGFPGQMLAVVYDGNRALYVSPFDGYTISTASDLEERLAAMGFGVERGDLLRPVTAREVVARCARNVFDRLERGTVSANGMPALYGALSSLKMVGQRGPLAEAQFSALVAIHFPYDVCIWETLEDPEWQDHILRTRLNDVTKRQPKSRFEQSREIQHRVGVVFRHRLFGYFAIITGWDCFCDQSEHWIQQMRVDALPYGRYQPFYHALVVDGSSRYVAQENIMPLPNPEIDEPSVPATPTASTTDAGSDSPVSLRTTQARQRLLARFGLFNNHAELAAATRPNATPADAQAQAAAEAAAAHMAAAAAGGAAGENDDDNIGRAAGGVTEDGPRTPRPTTSESEIEREHAIRSAADLCANPEIGRYFRFYRGGRFVLGSDLREEYPDDVDHELDDDDRVELDEAAREARRRKEEELDDEFARLS